MADLVPVPKEVLVEIASRKNDMDAARERAQAVAALAAVEVMEEFQAAFRSGPDPQTGVDVNAWIRIGEILLSRSIPKIAAKHVQTDGDTIDSVDKIALRESIEELMKRDR
jgi:hypothetical protein